MKIKTSDLTGAALDWAVAQCEGKSAVLHDDGVTRCIVVATASGVYKGMYKPSAFWSIGGPIIERESISAMLSFRDSYAEGANAKPAGWCAKKYQYGVLNEPLSYGPTPLVAAMRCFVSSKLGDAVDVPDETI